MCIYIKIKFQSLTDRIFSKYNLLLILKRIKTFFIETAIENHIEIAKLTGICIPYINKH